MPKMMLHHGEARAALARGVAKLTMAVQGTLGPKGMNAIVDRPIGTPMVSRDGVTIAEEIELPDRFENMGAQVVREVSKQTNEVAGDGTTTATILANALVQEGVKVMEAGRWNPVDLVAGIDRACAAVLAGLRAAARPLPDETALEQVATVAANDPRLGRMIAEALIRTGADGIVEVEYGIPGTPTELKVLEGMAFDRGYISHHMVTDVESMTVRLDDPYILLTDNKITSPGQITHILDSVGRTGRPLLIVAEEVSQDAVVTLMAYRREGRCMNAVVNPPDFGHWRQAMMEDIAILTGGRVIARDLGGRVEHATLADLGTAAQVRARADETAIIRGGGEPEAIRARRAQVQHQFAVAPPNVERDKLEQRLARLTGGTATILVGGATPVEQKRLVQILDDSLNAARCARDEGIVPGGGTALVQVAPALDELEDGIEGGAREGIELFRRALFVPLACIAENCGLNGAEIASKAVDCPPGVGFDARSGHFADLIEAGVIDPVRVTLLAVENATSVARLILTTHTLVGDLPENVDPTEGPCVGGGAEKLGRQ